MELMIVAKVYSPSRGQLIDLALPPGKNLEAGGILEEPGRLSYLFGQCICGTESSIPTWPQKTVTIGSHLGMGPLMWETLQPRQRGS